MQQYLQLLRDIQEKGTHKPPAREGMPGSQSLFGYQFRHNLGEGFPLLTTKKMFWKGITTELIWFLRGDTNIKYLIDNGVNIWNEDAYNYYLKVCREQSIANPVDFETFINWIKTDEKLGGWYPSDYTPGDCGYQYGKVWRSWYVTTLYGQHLTTDQIFKLIDGLKKTPESRRHIVTAIDPAHDNQLALYWCHAMFQFNCRPITPRKRTVIASEQGHSFNEGQQSSSYWDQRCNELGIPKYYLDCQLYQRSADAVLGVPFNIASYALLIHIVAKICNMIPGEFIHTFGDVHIYDNHKEAVEEQLSRSPRALPTLTMGHSESFWQKALLHTILTAIKPEDFVISGYNPQDKINAKLSTGLK